MKFFERAGCIVGFTESAYTALGRCSGQTKPDGKTARSIRNTARRRRSSLAAWYSMAVSWRRVICLSFSPTTGSLAVAATLAKFLTLTPASCSSTLSCTIWYMGLVGFAAMRSLTRLLIWLTSAHFNFSPGMTPC
jgi:hypothetical protein